MPKRKTAADFRNPENWERILTAGIEEFAEVGFKGARVDRIAQRSGLNKQLIYHYFVNKKGLYDAVIERMLRRTAPPVDAPTDIIDAVRLSSADSDVAQFHRLLGWEGLEYDGTDIAHVELRTEAFALVRAQFEQLETNGRIDGSLDPEILTLLYAMAIIGPRVLPQLTKIITGLAGDSPELASRVLDTLDGLLGLQRVVAR